MRTEIERVLEQVDRSYAGDAWHGPSIAEAFEGVDVKTAMARVPSCAHTIAELAVHLEYVQDAVLKRLEGRGRLTTEADCWPALPHPFTESEWSALQQRIREGAAALGRAIAAFPAARLDQPLVEGGSSASMNMHGQAQHNAYHAGQIMLMKKLIQGRSVAATR